MSDHPDIAVAPATADLSADNAAAANDAANDAAPQVLSFTFTGSGAEYFRIWVVNLLLTLATLGIYSAWAKVRRLQYFDRNTGLAGAAFDFRGDPKAVLRGRVLALVLLAANHYAFGFSVALGLGVVAVLLLALPFLMRGALRFRLSNTYYRGLPFGFSGSVAGAYGAYLLPIATFLVPGALLALAPDSPLAMLAFLPYLAWPLMHARMKRYQHAHLLYGGEQSSYDVAARRFWRPYLLAALLALLGGIVASVLGVVVIGLVSRGGAQGAMNEWGTAIAGFLYIIVFLYVAYVVTGPYLQVRIANLAWSHTAFRGVRIESRLKARGFMKLQSVNVLLTLLTLGLYRPFAAVRVHRYRLAHLGLHVDGDFGRLVDTAAPRRPGAAGDGAADFLGVDLSW